MENYDHFSNYAAVIRDMIQHENDVTNNRLTWMLVLQGILFTAAASFAKIHVIPFFVISLLGIATTISVFYALYLSRKARNYLRDLWRKNIADHPELERNIPPVAGDSPRTIRLPFLNPWILMPLAIVISWVVIICWRISNDIPLN